MITVKEKSEFMQTYEQDLFCCAHFKRRFEHLFIIYLSAYINTHPEKDLKRGYDYDWATF